MASNQTKNETMQWLDNVISKADNGTDKGTITFEKAEQLLDIVFATTADSDTSFTTSHNKDQIAAKIKIIANRMSGELKREGNILAQKWIKE